VTKSLGYFDDEEAAARGYDTAAIDVGLVLLLNFDDYELPETASASPAPHRVHCRFRGVNWNAANRKWNARLDYTGVPKHVGYFDDAEAAAQAYDEAAIKRGLLNRLNFHYDP
jgi:hypothetical protein